jgi:hypothetical protein
MLKIKIDSLQILFFVYTIYVFFNILYLFDNIPKQDSFPTKYKIGIFLPYILSTYFLILFLLNIYSKNSYQMLDKWFRILMNIFFLHNTFVLILIFLYILKLNPLMLGVDLGYNIPRGFAFVTEPSYSAMISLMSAIYFFKVSNFKFFISIIAFLFTQSGTAILTIIIIFILYIFTNLNRIKTYIYILSSIVLLFFLTDTFFGHQLDKIIDFLNIFFNDFDYTSLSMRNPRANNFIDSIYQLNELSFSEYIFGRGVGSVIYYLGSYQSTINFYPIQILLEGGLVMIILHLLLLIKIYTQIKAKQKYLYIVFTINTYWLINGGAFFYMFYVIAFHIYYLAKKEKQLNGSR